MVIHGSCNVKLVIDREKWSSRGSSWREMIISPKNKNHIIFLKNKIFGMKVFKVMIHNSFNIGPTNDFAHPKPNTLDLFKVVLGSFKVVQPKYKVGDVNYNKKITCNKKKEL